MDNKLFFKESVLPVTLFCSALMFSPIEVAQVNAATNVVQQAKTVKGTVVDNIGEPVIGASVKVVGTTNGAVTDLDGNFALTNVPKNATVEISYIGYTTQKVSVAGKSDLKVTLQEDNKALDEVVVVGYGVQRKSDVTGALAHLAVFSQTAAPSSGSSYSFFVTRFRSVTSFLKFSRFSGTNTYTLRFDFPFGAVSFESLIFV